MQDIRFGSYNMLPPVVKNLIIINVLFYLGTIGMGSAFHIDLNKYLGLHYFLSPDFQPYQIITYLFMHSSRDFTHILFNMFGLWMFGTTLENFWGPKKFLIYYMVAGIGAGLIQWLTMYISFTHYASALPQNIVDEIIKEGPVIFAQGKNYINGAMGHLNAVLNTTVIGASGAVYGLLLAFGMMFPNSLIYVYFLFPIKAKWFVAIFGAIELFSGIRNSATDNVAHFAHLGGMLFGFILIKIWQKQKLV